MAIGAGTMDKLFFTFLVQVFPFELYASISLKLYILDDKDNFILLCQWL